MQQIISFFTENLFETVATFAGIIYIILSVKQKIFMWPFGIISSALYIYVFLKSGFYAGMSLQFYYTAAGIFGWYFWYKYKNTEETELPVTKTGKKDAILYLSAGIIVFIIYTLILLKTDSDIVILDSLTTSAGIIATFMLIRKKIEQWIIWIVVDLISVGLYIHKDLYPTVLLYTTYTVLAFIGYFTWKKQLKLNSELN